VLDEPVCDDRSCTQSARAISWCGSHAERPAALVLETRIVDCSPGPLPPGRHAIAALMIRDPSNGVIGLRLGVCPVIIPESYFEELCQQRSPPAPQAAGCASCTVSRGPPEFFTEVGIALVAFGVFFRGLRQRRRADSLRRTHSSSMSNEAGHQ
jgi:hypothetical protein